MNPCDTCKYKKGCRSLSDFELTCEEVERIATDYYTKAKEAIHDPAVDDSLEEWTTGEEPKFE